MRRRLLLGHMLLCCVSAPARAGAPPVPIEGNLWVSGYAYEGGWFARAYYLHGASDQVTAWPAETDHADMSPLGDALVYQVTAGQPYTNSGEIWVTALDGSVNRNVSQAAGLSGVNCFPYWSPDATQIAFRHAAPAAGQRPCDAGFEPWVMKVDGTEARRVSPEGSGHLKLGGWSADGRRLICARDGTAVSLALDGTGLQSLPNLRGEGASFSPDARHLAGTWAFDGTEAGQAGTYRQLVVTDPDGGDPQVLVSQFVSYADAEAMVTRLGLEGPVDERVGDVIWWAGPVFPQWSPNGDRIAFLAALPFDPAGDDYRLQVQVWVYTLATRDLTQITDESEFHTWISWHGGNTSADHPAVTVDNTTVSFAQVDKPGLTTIIWQEDPPAFPVTYQPVGSVFRIGTSAQVSGPTAVAMTYAEADVPATARTHLTLLRYDEAAQQWTGLPTTRDTAHQTVSGQPPSLGLLGLAWPLPSSHFSDVSSSAGDPYWALWEVEAAYAAGVVQGYQDGTYGPARPVTRDQMAVYVSRALAGGDAEVPTAPATASFTDVPTDSWAYKYVEYAKQTKVVTGYSDQTYRPTGEVTRDQMAVYISRAVVDPTGDEGLASYTPPTTASFADVPVGSWAYRYVEYAKSQNIVQGYSDGYRPGVVVTRDQMAVYVARAFDLLP